MGLSRRLRAPAPGPYSFAPGVFKGIAYFVAQLGKHQVVSFGEKPAELIRRERHLRFEGSPVSAR